MRVWWCRGYEDNEGVVVQRVRGQGGCGGTEGMRVRGDTGHEATDGLKAMRAREY